MSKKTKQSQQWFRPQEQDIKGRKVAYVNARVIDPASKTDFAATKKGGVLTIGDTIADIGPSLFANGIPSGAEVVDCDGHVLAPGIVDLQVHFREPGQLHKESIETGSKSAVAGGVTAAVCMPNTKPTLDTPEMIHFLKQRESETSYMRVFPYGAISTGISGSSLTEMALMKDAGAVGFTDDGKPMMNSLLMRRALEYSKMLDLPIAQHAEDGYLFEGGVINEGKVSAKLGVRGIPNICESIMVERDIALTELTGGHYHVLHVSTRQSMEAIRRAKEKGLNVTCEVAPHHYLLTDDAVLTHKANAKMNPPLRSEEDRKALIQALKDGVVDAIATDHAPHEPESKNVPLEQATFGIVGVETLLPLALALVQQKTLPLMRALALLTCQPASIIRKPFGRLKKGAPADLVVIDLETQWTIDVSAFASRCKNSPFDGRKVTGRAIRTIVGGKTVYRLDS